jgi:hypothetical protein
MARQRLLKPEFFHDEPLAACPPHVRLLFEGLWVLADREGRLRDQSAVIHGAIFPYEPQLNVPEMLDALHRGGFVTRYEVEGRRYIQILNFLKHQKPHVKEMPSVIPPPESGREIPVLGPEIPRPSRPESVSVTESVTESEPVAPAPAVRLVVMPPMTPERAALIKVRREVSAELGKVLAILGPASDGQRELARASKTPTGSRIVNVEGCDRLPWLTTTRDRLIERRMELEERRREDAPPAEPELPPADPGAVEFFDAVRTRLSGALDPRAFATWIRPLTGQGWRGSALEIRAPNEQFRTWVSTNYSAQIKRALMDMGKPGEFALVVEREQAQLHDGAL